MAPNNWRRAKAMLHFDDTGELRRKYLITCLQRNRNTQLRVRALQEVGALRDPEAFDEAVEIVGGWSRDERREGVKMLLQALAERPIGRRDQASPLALAPGRVQPRGARGVRGVALARDQAPARVCS